MSDYRSADEVDERLREIRAELDAIEAQHEGRKFPQEVKDTWNTLYGELRELKETRDELARREVLLREAAADPNRQETTDPPPRGSLSRGLQDAVRDDALRVVDRHRNKDVLSSTAADRLDRIVRHADPMNTEAKYLAAVGAPDYESAFGKLLLHPQDAHIRMTPRELESVRTVTQVMSERAMSEGVTTAGGYGVPVAVDPTILLSSNGAINPIRELARTFTITTNKWTGVSGSVTANFTAENTEAADGTPTLAQPSVQVQKAQVFVPFSIEVGEDYVGLQQELAKIIADAKDVLEAQKFLDGSGTNEPAGIVGTSGLTTTQRIQTTTVAVTAVGDIYLLKQALPARWLPQGTFVAHATVVDVFRRFVGGGNTTEPFVVENGQLLNRPTREWTNMVTTTTTTGSKIVLFADWQQAFAIVDRIGLSVELIPHMMGAAGRPLGQRGVYAYWRTGSGVLVPAAARYLEVK
jgi:HK97 family phage major capsid protein